jgi:hypothetical protein
MEKPKKRFERIPLVEVRKLLGEHKSAGQRSTARDAEQLEPPKPARKNMVTYTAKAAAAGPGEKKSQ